MAIADVPFKRLPGIVYTMSVAWRVAGFDERSCNTFCHYNSFACRGVRIYSNFYRQDNWHQQAKAICHCFVAALCFAWPCSGHTHCAVQCARAIHRPRRKHTCRSGLDGIWTFPSRALSFPGAESPHRELSFPWNFRSLELSLLEERLFHGTFAPVELSLPYTKIRGKS